MSRPRSNILKIGDKISHNKKDGVVVFVEPNSDKPYSVHFFPDGRGVFKYNELKKVRPIFNVIELEKSQELLKGSIDV